MAILKAPPRQPKNETIQLRVSQDLKFRLTRYAEFLHATTSYVVSEALERLFRKDDEFQEFLAVYKPAESPDHTEQKTVHPSHNNALNTPKK